MNSSRTKDPAARTRAGVSRGPRAVLCAVATVVLGPAAATASALDQANAAPLHHAVEADQTHAYLPSETSGRRVARLSP
ncbi:hypothetical protein [Streptomyces chartreusis]|uniref:hypothetical protein n=1 Tax=Streptomyces chartreusis TaxID=1969 RepID=UPI0033A387B8